MELSQYYPVLLFILMGTLIGIAPITLGWLGGVVLGHRKPDAEKLSPYECGFEAFEDARMKFDVRYYLIAILFILFDLETALLFPFAAAAKDVGITGFWTTILFVVELLIGFVYLWKKGALDWE